jgi:dolichol-phosphate mannosyltransferase
MEESVVSDNGDPQNIPSGVHSMPTVLDVTNDTEVTPQHPIASDRLAVIVPVYNEERTVAELLRRLEVQPCVSQIIIVDDGSTDGTWEELAPWRARASANTAVPLSDGNSLSVIVVQHDKNRGKGRAIRTALEHGGCSHVVIQDADLEYNPEDINKLWDVMLTGEADVVLGSRYLNNPQLEKGRRLMQMGVRTLNALVRMFYGLRLTDSATCYKMFRTSSLRTMGLKCERFEFCAEVVAKALMSHLSIREVPVEYHFRTRREGKKLRLTDGLVAVGTICGHAISSRYWIALFSLLFLMISVGSVLLFYPKANAREMRTGDPTVVWDQDSLADVVYNCGRVPVGEVVSHTFAIENASASSIASETVEISKSCGCTSAQLKNVETIQPNGQVLVDVTVKTDQKEGVFRESVIVQFSGQTARCTLTGIAFPAIRAEPSDARIVVDDSEIRESHAVVSLVSELPLNWSLMDVAIPWPELTWAFKDSEGGNGRFTLSYSSKGKVLRMRRSGPLVITVPDSKNGIDYVCNIRVTIEPLESLRVIPQVISAGATTENGLSVFRFFVKGNAPMALARESLAVVSRDAQFHVASVEKLTERLWRVHVEAPKCSEKKVDVTIQSSGETVSAAFLFPD